jgi:hypothetical protein
MTESFATSAVERKGKKDRKRDKEKKTHTTHTHKHTLGCQANMKNVFILHL